MTYKECAGVLVESMVVGVCVGAPVVWFINIITNIS
jgi:hypothetical protein